MDISATSIYQDIGKQTTKEAKLKEACVEFESILISQMLKGLRATVNKSDLVDGGTAGDMWEDVLYTQYAKQMARTASFGLAEMIYKQASKRL
ncbi:rod-binding protein [bacterium]|nr:rod-binding protein [bacterium]